MKGPVFVDSNVLVYVRDASDGEKHRKAAEWVDALWRSRSGRLSFQVLHEYYLIVTQKLKPGLARELAREDIRDLMSWRPVVMDSALLQGAVALEDRYSLPFRDALIASAAQLSRCAILLSEGFQAGRELDGVTVVNPFEKSPALLE